MKGIREDKFVGNSDKQDTDRVTEQHSNVGPSNTADLNALQVTSLDAWLHLSGQTHMYISEGQGTATTNTEHFLERLDIFQRKNTPGTAMLYGNYGLGSFPESQLPLFLIICYSSPFQSKRRSDLWEITYKMKYGWLMINGSYDMCLQKCKRAQTSRRGRLTWGDTRGFAYE